MAETQKNREAGFRNIRRLALLFILLGFFCFASSNRVSLETVKTNVQILTERLKMLKTIYHEGVKHYHGWKAVTEPVLHALMELGEHEFADSPSFILQLKGIRDTIQQLKDLDKYIEDVRSEMNESEEELERQMSIIKSLESHRVDEL